MKTNQHLAIVAINVENMSNGIHKDIRWIWKLSYGRRVTLAMCCLTEIVNMAVSILFVWLSKHLIDIATGVAIGSIATYAVYLVTCIVTQLALSALSTRIEARQEILMRSDIRCRLFSKIMESRWTGKESLHSGDTLNRLMEDVSEVSETVCITVPKLSGAVAQLFMATYFVYRVDWKLAIILFLTMPVAIALSKSCILKLRRLNRAIKDSDSKVQSHIQDNIQHRTLISALEHTDTSITELADKQSELTDKVMVKTDYSLFARTMIRLGFSGGYALVLVWGVLGLQSGTLTFGMMAAFLQLVGQIQRPAIEMSREIPGFIKTLASAQRLSELDSLPQENKENPVMLQGTAGIKIESVSFAYPDGNRKIFDNFSYDFTPGSLTAICGETGIGKSTLIRLILAQLEPDAGSISLYSSQTDIKEKARPATRCNFVYVPQGNTLISGTIRDNLLIGNSKASDEEMRTALHTAVADFVYELADGIDTVCGESGAGLSEGQAQRIAIARGLLRPGSILLLDEPSSALDKETETKLFSRLESSAENKTVIIITHRDATSRLCNNTLQLS